MSALEIVTFGTQKQLLNERTEPKEADIPSESEISLQTSEGDIVTLGFTDEQSLSQIHGKSGSEVETVREISSIAHAASTFSQVVEGELNEDELVAIQKLAEKIEPIAKEFLSSDPEELDVEQ